MRLACSAPCGSGAILPPWPHSAGSYSLRSAQPIRAPEPSWIGQRFTRIALSLHVLKLAPKRILPRIPGLVSQTLPCKVAGRIPILTEEYDGPRKERIAGQQRIKFFHQPTECVGTRERHAEVRPRSLDLCMKKIEHFTHRRKSCPADIERLETMQTVRRRCQGIGRCRIHGRGGEQHRAPDSGGQP